MKWTKTPFFKIALSPPPSQSQLCEKKTDDNEINIKLKNGEEEEERENVPAAVLPEDLCAKLKSNINSETADCGYGCGGAEAASAAHFTSFDFDPDIFHTQVQHPYEEVAFEQTEKRYKKNETYVHTGPEGFQKMMRERIENSVRPREIGQRFAFKITDLFKEVDADKRYELCTRLDTFIDQCQQEQEEYQYQCQQEQDVDAFTSECYSNSNSSPLLLLLSSSSTSTSSQQEQQQQQKNLDQPSLVVVVEQKKAW